jgi:hypothetical protein
MVWLLELLTWFMDPIVNLVLAAFGYDSDWEPTRPRAKPRHPGVSGLICLAITLLVFAGLIGLVIVLARIFDE